MFKHACRQVLSKTAAALLIILMGLSACFPKTAEASVKRAETRTVKTDACEPSSSSSRSIPEDVSREMIAFYSYFEQRVQERNFTETAPTQVTWSGSTSAEELITATTLPIWAYMKLIEDYPYNPFVLLESVSNTYIIREWYALKKKSLAAYESSDKSVLHMYEFRSGDIQSKKKDRSPLSDDTLTPEYSVANCEKLLAAAGFSAPVYEAEDCLYSYFGSIGMGDQLGCTVAAVYFFPDAAGESIDHAEIQFLYYKKSIQTDLYGGWAGHSTSGCMFHDSLIMDLVFIIDVLELTLAGETDIIDRVGSDADGVPANYIPGSGNSDMQAELSCNDGPFGYVYNYSLHHE